MLGRLNPLICVFAAVIANSAGAAEDFKGLLSDPITVKSYLPLDNKFCIQGLSSKQVEQLLKWGMRKTGTIDAVETENFERGAVCLFNLLDTKDKVHYAVALKPRAGDAFEELYIAPPSAPGEDCGMNVQVVHIHMMNFVPAGAAKPKPYLAIEFGTETPGCNCSADRQELQFSIFDVEAGPAPLFNMKLGKSCQPDRQCDKKCEKSDKKVVNRGTLGRVNWEWCDNTCDSVEIKFEDFDLKKKHSEILAVDAGGKFSLKK